MNTSLAIIVLKKQQSGVVLIVSLIILLLLTMISVTGLQVTGMEEKMANNTIDKNRAFQAAETALRYAELDINSVRISGVINFVADCTNGLCFNGATPYINIEDQPLLVANAVAIQTFAGAPTIAGVAQQPRYLITAINTVFEGNAVTMYRITAFGTGSVITTTSVLQELFLPGGP